MYLYAPVSPVSRNAFSETSMMSNEPLLLRTEPSASAGARSSLLSPKSASLMLLLPSSKQLAGFRSRCMTACGRRPCR